MNLTFENNRLRQGLKTASNIQHNLFRSFSAIAPINEGNKSNLSFNLPIVHESLDDESEEKFNKIENLMTELTRLMESLDNPHDNITNTFIGCGAFSNSGLN